MNVLAHYLENRIRIRSAAEPLWELQGAGVSLWAAASSNPASSLGVSRKELLTVVTTFSVQIQFSEIPYNIESTLIK